MKNVCLLLVIFFVVVSKSFAQQIDLEKVKMPDFPFEPMHLKDTYEMSSLPHEKHEMKVKSGMVGAKVFYQLNSVQSPFRFKKDQPLNLVVNQGLVNGTEVSVKDTYKLYKMEVSKGKRSFMSSAVKVSTVSQGDDLPIEFKKVKDGLWLLHIKGLEPGEYAILANNKLYTFGLE